MDTNPKHTESEKRPHGASDRDCLQCKAKGKAVKPITISTLVMKDTLKQMGDLTGFRFCATPSCELAYFNPETGECIAADDVTIPIGQKATSPGRLVCYCFNHTAEAIESEIERTGATTIPESIAKMCREGLDLCPETNPQGSCCLGNVRSVAKAAIAEMEIAQNGGPQ